MPRRKRLLIALIFFVAVAGPVLFVVLRSKTAPVAPPAPPVAPPAPPAVVQPEVQQPVAETPPAVPPTVAVAPDPAEIEAQRLAARRASALAAFQRGLALQRTPDQAGAVAAYQEAVELDPQMAGAWTNMGLALVKLNRTDDALKAAQRALDTPGLDDPKRRAHAQWVVGSIAEHAGSLDLAARAYAEALRADPSLAPAALALSNMQLAQGQDAAALATLIATLDAGSTNPSVATNIAILYLSSREASKAVDAARLALRSNPDHPEANKVLGYAQLALKRWSDAAQNLDEAARFDIGNADLQTALGYAYEKLGRRDDALAAFDRALMLKANHPQALQNRAVTLDRMGEAEEAQRAYERVMATRTAANPAGNAPPPASQLQLAIIAARKSDWPEARRLAEPVVAAEPKNAMARYVLGLACFHLNDRVCASEQEYELTPLDSERAAALRKLISKH
ncbi:MAG: tetratricopeptide repeat protein [Phycisphaerae bacterium]|nr:tetratricopeptide repeat protein [Phycisphaerae bacterium]